MVPIHMREGTSTGSNEVTQNSLPGSPRIMLVQNPGCYVDTQIWESQPCDFPRTNYDEAGYTMVSQGIPSEDAGSASSEVMDITIPFMEQRDSF